MKEASRYCELAQSSVNSVFCVCIAMYILRGVKDWVHMKTAKMMQDFNWLCNLDVNHKLLLIYHN